MREVLMIRQTVQRTGRQLEQLASKGVPMERCFDIVGRKARTIEEIVVIEVMREVWQELCEQEIAQQAYADSSTRSARMPSIALSR